MLPNRRAAVAGSAAVVLAVAAVLVVTGAVRDRRSPVHTVLCAAPTASWSPGSPTAVGAPGAARVGPFTFHPAVTGVPGTPARVIIHPVEASRTVLTMTGWNCRTGRPFRFWYAPYGVDGELPRPVRQAPDEGATAVTIPALAAGDDYLGYMLFPGAGEWDVELRDGTALVGNLLFVLPDAR